MGSATNRRDRPPRGSLYAPITAPPSAFTASASAPMSPSSSTCGRSVAASVVGSSFTPRRFFVPGAFLGAAFFFFAATARAYKKLPVPHRGLEACGTTSEASPRERSDPAERRGNGSRSEAAGARLPSQERLDVFRRLLVRRLALELVGRGVVAVLALPVLAGRFPLLLRVLHQLLGCGALAALTRLLHGGHEERRGRTLGVARVRARRCET